MEKLPNIIIAILIINLLASVALFYCIYRVWLFFKCEKPPVDDADPYTYS